MEVVFCSGSFGSFIHFQVHFRAMKGTRKKESMFLRSKMPVVDDILTFLGGGWVAGWQVGGWVEELELKLVL